MGALYLFLPVRKFIGSNYPHIEYHLVRYGTIGRDMYADVKANTLNAK